MDDAAALAVMTFAAAMRLDDFARELELRPSCGDGGGGRVRGRARWRRSGSRWRCA